MVKTRVSWAKLEVDASFTEGGRSGGWELS
jgi:hypothetical protein